MSEAPAPVNGSAKVCQLNAQMNIVVLGVVSRTVVPIKSGPVIMAYKLCAVACGYLVFPSSPRV